MKVAILVVEGAFDSGLATVQDVLATANALGTEVSVPPPQWQVNVVGLRRYIHTGNGHRVTAIKPDELDWPPDVLIAPALGFKPAAALFDAVRSPPLRSAVELVNNAAQAGTHVASGCSGALLLAEAGVLDGHDATTSWWLGPQFRRRYPDVRLDTSATLVVGEHATTAGAAFAHIDLALSLVQQRSPALAEIVARHLLIGQRSSQASFAMPTMLARRSPDVTAFERWVRAHLDQPIRISDAATALGLSERTLQRLTANAVGLSPVQFVNETRVDHAVHLLRTTDLSTRAIAKQIGYQDPTSLRLLIRRRRGITLRQLRADTYPSDANGQHPPG